MGLGSNQQLSFIVISSDFFRHNVDSFQNDLAIQLVSFESSKGVVPSDEVVALLAQNLAKLKDVKRLAALRSSLPLQTSSGDKIYDYELSLRLSNIHQVNQWSSVSS